MILVTLCKNLRTRTYLLWSIKMNLDPSSSYLIYFSCLICYIKWAEIYKVSRSLRDVPCVKISTSETMYNCSYKCHIVLLVINQEKWNFFTMIKWRNMNNPHLLYELSKINYYSINYNHKAYSDNGTPSVQWQCTKAQCVVHLLSVWTY